MNHERNVDILSVIWETFSPVEGGYHRLDQASASISGKSARRISALGGSGCLMALLAVKSEYHSEIPGHSMSRRCGLAKHSEGDPQ